MHLGFLYLASGRHIHAVLARSFFQGLCVLGYCIAPLDIAALISCFVRVIWVRAPVALAAWAWCIWGMIGLYDSRPLSG
jgi:hypothetical protein